MLSAESCCNVQQRPWTLHWNSAGSPFSSTRILLLVSLPCPWFPSHFSASAVYIASHCCKRRVSPEQLYFYPWFSKNSRVFNLLLWPQYFHDWRNQRHFLLPGQAEGFMEISLEVDYPCPDGMRGYRQTCFSYHPVLPSPLLKCFTYIQLLPMLIYFKTPHIHVSQDLIIWMEKILLKSFFSHK